MVSITEKKEKDKNQAIRYLQILRLVASHLRPQGQLYDATILAHLMSTTAAPVNIAEEVEGKLVDEVSHGNDVGTSMFFLTVDTLTIIEIL